MAERRSRTGIEAGAAGPMSHRAWAGWPIVSLLLGGLLLAPRIVAAEPPDLGAVAGEPVDEALLARDASLDHVTRFALQNNPAIRAAEQAWRAARERITRRSSYENPLVAFSPDTGATPETRAGPQGNGLEVSQKIPFPGKLTLRGRIASSLADATLERLNGATQEIAREARARYADYFLALRSLAINDETTALALEFADIASAKYRVGNAAQQDVILSQERISRLAAERVEFEGDHESARGALNTLLDRDPRAPLGPPSDLSAEPLSVPLAALLAAAVRERPELRSQDRRVEARDRSVRLARMGYLPDFQLGAQYVAVDDGTNPVFRRDGNDIVTVKLGLSIPLWFNRVRAEVSEARAQLAEERARRRDLANRVNDEIQKSYERVRAAARTERIYHTTLIPQTEERIAAARAGYQTGRVDFLTLIDSLDSLEEVQLQRDRAVRDYHRGIADLERAVGAPLRALAP